MLAVLVGLLAFSPSPASAAVTGRTDVNFFSTVAVGDVGMPAYLEISNLNTGAESSQNNTICNSGDAAPCPNGNQGITLTPSCSSIAGGVCTANGADPDVFRLSPTATGQSGTGCAGTTFDVALFDTTFGTYRFTPQVAGAHVVLGGCRINFTFDVLKLPTDASPSTTGTQTVQVATTTQHNGTTSSFSTGTDQTRVSRVETMIDTTASPPITLGSGTLTDTATVFLRNPPEAGATVTFNLYGPDDADCSATPVLTSTVPHPRAPGLVTSAAFSPTTAGTYRWIANYSGDGNNVPESGACNDNDESTVVYRASPTIATVASPTVALGSGTLTDTATVSGRASPQPGATVTFNLYGPDNADCSGTPVFTSTLPQPASPGAVTSAAFAPAAIGTYRWVASYSGDANNNPAGGACNDTGEVVVVTTASATTATVSPATAVVRSTRATVLARVRAGGVNATGGDVNVYVDNVFKGRVPVSNGLATLRLPVFSSIGRREIRVEYTGVAGVTRASATRVGLGVVKALPRVTLAVRPATVHKRRTRPLLAIAVTALGQVVSGDVAIRVQGRHVARVRLVGGRSQVRLPRFVARGPKRVLVTFLGNGIAEQATSAKTFRVVR